MKTRGFPATPLAVACWLSLSVAGVPGVRGGDMPRPAPAAAPPKIDAMSSRLGHLTLDDAIDIALHRNPDILRLLQEIQRNEGLLITVRAAALPQVVATGSFTQTDEDLLTSSRSSTGGTRNAEVYLRTVTAPTTADPTGANTTKVGAISGSQLIGNVFGTSSGSSSTVGTGTGTSTSTGTTSLSSLFGSSSSTSPRNYTVQIEVQQTLYNAAIPPAIRQQKFQRDAAYYALREQVDTTVNTVKTDFYTVLFDKAQIDIQNENLRLLQSQLTDQQNRFAAGTVPRFDVLQASVAVANQRPLVITATNNYALAYIGLARTLGIEYSPEQEREAPIKLVGNLDYHPQTLSIDEGVQAGKANRALLKQQRLNILSEVEQIRIAAAGYQPVLTGNAGYEITNDRVSDDLGQTLHGYFLGANFNWNIFDGLATYGRVKQARAALREARILYEDTVKLVVQDVRTNYDNLQQFKETIASQVLNVSEAEEAVRLAQARLSAGAGTQLDVLQSQNQLLTAQTTELQARYNYAVALGNYERVTGTSTVYDEAFYDPLTTRKYPSGSDPTGTAVTGKTMPLGTIRTPDAQERGSGKPLKKKINAQDPKREARPAKPVTQRDYLLEP